MPCVYNYVISGEYNIYNYFPSLSHFGINEPINGTFVNELVVESNKKVNESNIRTNSHRNKKPNIT